MTENKSMLHNDATQAERRDLLRQALRNERQSPPQPSTYSSHTPGLVNETRGGRYNGHQPATIVGSDPTVSVPRISNSSPWVSERLLDEEPLGFSVEDHLPVGEPHELAASIDQLQTSRTQPPEMSETGPATPMRDAQLPSAAGVAGPSIPKSIRRI